MRMRQGPTPRRTYQTTLAVARDLLLQKREPRARHDWTQSEKSRTRGSLSTDGAACHGRSADRHPSVWIKTHDALAAGLLHGPHGGELDLGLTEARQASRAACAEGKARSCGGRQPSWEASLASPGPPLALLETTIASDRAMR